MSEENNVNEITKFIFEMGQLKNVKRSGWWIAKIKDPESVAEHSFRAGILGFVLAKMEGCDPYKTAMMCLINDLQEARLNDLHKIGHRYIDFKKAEGVAIREQLAPLGQTGEELLGLFNQFHTESSKEGIIARDADLLECAFQAKEYLEIGHKDTQNWIDNTEKKLVTESAKKLLEEMKNINSSDWWKGLKKVDR